MKPTSKKNKRDGAWYALPAVTVGVFLLFTVVGGLGYFEFSPPEKTCISCHEIVPSYGHWTNSIHRSVSCKKCHGGSVTSVHALRENVKRVVSHLTQTRHDNIRLSEEQTVNMLQACQGCHAREFAYWQQGGHGTNYARIFMDEKHNKTEQMADECLRCHGMFFEGKMASMVTPLDTKGPWRFRNPATAERPVIPCLACHDMHAPGQPFKHPASRMAGPTTNMPAFRRDILAFYVRQEGAHFAIDDLAVPKIFDQGRPVKVSSDPRQRLCTQCHAPNAFGQAGTGDDRTPTGVHEGVSCVACHAPHSNDTRASCALCHPARSSCGLDVTHMDTSFRTAKSKNNVHTMRCLDCHPAGVPKKPGGMKASP
jgi:hypothetical protein